MHSTCLPGHLHVRARHGLRGASCFLLQVPVRSWGHLNRDSQGSAKGDAGAQDTWLRTLRALPGCVHVDTSSAAKTGTDQPPAFVQCWVQPHSPHAAPAPWGLAARRAPLLAVFSALQGVPQ